MNDCSVRCSAGVLKIGNRLHPFCVSADSFCRISGIIIEASVIPVWCETKRRPLESDDR